MKTAGPIAHCVFTVCNRHFLPRFLTGIVLRKLGGGGGHKRKSPGKDVVPGIVSQFLKNGLGFYLRQFNREWSLKILVMSGRIKKALKMAESAFPTLFFSISGAKYECEIIVKKSSFDLCIIGWVDIGTGTKIRREKVALYKLKLL